MSVMSKVKKIACWKCVQVYVEVRVTEPADFFLLRINECWATQTSEPNTTDVSSHTLLQNGSELLLITTVHLSFVLFFGYDLHFFHSYSWFSSLFPGVWRTKLLPFLMWVQDSLAVTERVPPFATALKCFASQQSLITSICTALCSCVSQTTTSPARLWAHLTAIFDSLKRLMRLGFISNYVLLLKDTYDVF